MQGYGANHSTTLSDLVLYFVITFKFFIYLFFLLMFQVVLFISLSAVASLFTQICREFESETISEIQKKCSNANTTLCERSRVTVL